MKRQITRTGSLLQRLVSFCFLGCMLLAWVGAQAATRQPLVPQWGKWEITLTSTKTYSNAVQEASLVAVFVSPQGEQWRVPGFWDGGRTWRVRFMPRSPGAWTWRTECTDTANRGLHGITGRFLCVAARSQGGNRFAQHGPVRVSPDGRYLVHDDMTPFFWLADTAWNGPLKATDAEWAFYLETRARQKFTAVQWVTTQWRAAPDGNREGELAYTGRERIVVNPAFFQKLDRRVEAMNRAGLLSVPVLLWAIQGGSNPQINPGVSLPEDQAALLARYMVARWQADAVVWILNGDGDYRGEKAEKWRRIGRMVFGDIAHAPVTCHPGGRMWVRSEFITEPWYDLVGYQSGHNDRDDNLRWITSGPAAREWQLPPIKPFISLEAPYENHMGGSAGPMGSEVVRRAHYWSLLNAPTAGVTYGGHGIWGWDDGTRPPVDHPNTGTPLPWRQALIMPGAQQMTVLAEFFQSIHFWQLRPAPEILATQPGLATPRRFISAARSIRNDLMVLYVPEDRVVDLKLSALTSMKGSPVLTWVNPRNGERKAAVAVLGVDTCQVPTPEPGDWLLLVTTQ